MIPMPKDTVLEIRLSPYSMAEKNELRVTFHDHGVIACCVEQLGRGEQVGKKHSAYGLLILRVNILRFINRCTKMPRVAESRHRIRPEKRVTENSG